METYERWEDKVVESTRQDIVVAVEVLRRAIEREDSELGLDGLGNRLSLILDELLQWV